MGRAPVGCMDRRQRQADGSDARQAAQEPTHAPSGGMDHSRLRRMVHAGGDPDEPRHRDRARPDDRRPAGRSAPGPVGRGLLLNRLRAVFSAIAFAAGDAISAAYNRTRYRVLDRRQRRTRGPHVQHVRWPNADRYRHQAARPRFAPREIKTPPSNRAGCFVFCNVADTAVMARLLLGELVGPKENSPVRCSRAVTRRRLRESSSELMIDRSLASRAVRMQLAGPACLGKTPPAAIVPERASTHATSSRVPDHVAAAGGDERHGRSKSGSRKRCWSTPSPSGSR